MYCQKKKKKKNLDGREHCFTNQELEVTVCDAADACRLLNFLYVVLDSFSS